jgi:Fe-S cluster assembly iron-binding protein IscA
MIEVTKTAADAFRQLIAEQDAAGKKVRVTFDTGG